MCRPPLLRLGRVYDAAVCGTAMPALPLLSAATRCYTRVGPSDLRLTWVGGGVHDAAVPGTATPTHSLLAACTRCFVLVRVGPSEPTFENGRGVELYDAVVSDAAVSGTAVPSLSTLSLHTLLCTDYALSGLCSNWFTGWSCMIPRCLAQPYPLPLYSLPALAVVHFCRVSYGGNRSFSWLRL